jgi:hypothetical protein
MHGQAIEHAIFIFQVGVTKFQIVKTTFWHRHIQQWYHYHDMNVAPVSGKQ